MDFKPLVCFILLILLFIPPILTSLTVMHTISSYSNAERVEGKVVSCTSFQVNTTYNNDKYSTNYRLKVVTPTNGTVFGSFGYPSKEICESNIGLPIKVLILENGQRQVYTFLNFFMQPILSLGLVLTLYVCIWLFFRKYKKKVKG